MDRHERLVRDILDSTGPSITAEELALSLQVLSDETSIDDEKARTVTLLRKVVISLLRHHLEEAVSRGF